jgi:hypothetical protein
MLTEILSVHIYSKLHEYQVEQHQVMLGTHGMFQQEQLTVKL